VKGRPGASVPGHAFRQWLQDPLPDVGVLIQRRLSEQKRLDLFEFINCQQFGGKRCPECNGDGVQWHGRPSV
jgi:hypothetical protein